MSNKIYLTVLLALSICLNIYLIFSLYDKETNDSPAKDVTPSFRFVKPLDNMAIDSNVPEGSTILHYTDLKPMIENEISNRNASDDTGVFLQDLKTGAWLGIHERDGFLAASLLKIPIAMAILKRVDRGEIALTDEIVLSESDLDADSGNLYKEGAGAKLTIWEAIKIMILTSDNTAKNALKRKVDDAELNAVFAHVGIPNPYEPQNGPVVSPRGYSRIFKSLYFSTFLSPALSEKLLDLASDTQMESLISAGIPSEVQVSHKYGERPDGISDCGVIYEPKNPYLLCVMVRGASAPESKDLIATISKITFDFIHSK